MKCPFYCNTYDGERCILIPIEEWLRYRKILLKYCLGNETQNYKGCLIFKNKYMNIMIRNGIEVKE